MYGGHSVARKLTKLIEQIWAKEAVPQDFKDANIIKLYKKGKRSVCDNYRGISLLSIAGKILSRVILNRLNDCLVDTICSDSQCGFRKGRGTVGMVFSLRQIQEKAREQNKPLYMLFIDLTKAFDTVNREALWHVLSKVGMSDNLRNIIMSLHDGMKARVVLSKNASLPLYSSPSSLQSCYYTPS